MFRRLRGLIEFGAFFFLVSFCAAQVERSGLNGTVTDSSGRLLPLAHVTILENATGLRRETFTDGKGIYSVPELPVGTYSITFEHPDFKKVEFLDVEQVIGRTRTLDAALSIAGGEERVQVSSASELMDHYTSRSCMQPPHA